MLRTRKHLKFGPFSPALNSYIVCNYFNNVTNLIPPGPVPGKGKKLESQVNFLKEGVRMFIRPFGAAKDETRLLDLWATVFGATWPLTPAWLRQQTIDVETYRPGDHLLAEEDDKLIGFALTQIGTEPPTTGSVMAMGVHPAYRGQGVGRALHKAAVTRLKTRGAEMLQLGSGGFQYFWPGVPLEPDGAWAFFHYMGWPEIERSWDLVQSIENYTTPAWVWERVRLLGLAIEPSTPHEHAAVSDFVAKEYPGWAPYFEKAFKEDRAGDVVVARQPDGDLLGACLIESPTTRWAECFSGPTGAPGCVLTAQAARNQGIGLALTARATELAKARGCRTSFIGWTWLVEWYGKLGYRPWQSYVMSRRP